MSLLTMTTLEFCSNVSDETKYIPRANLNPLLSILAWIIADVSAVQHVKPQSRCFWRIIKEIYRSKEILNVCWGEIHFHLDAEHFTEVALWELYW